MVGQLMGKFVAEMLPNFLFPLTSVALGIMAVLLETYVLDGRPNSATAGENSKRISGGGKEKYTVENSTWTEQGT